ncbi:MAG: M23 family metallopeptidase, partial [Acidimicrobiia bacterium]|nr:M23 family metallopeptidase [Acidimicrobiia bacterium]
PYGTELRAIEDGVIERVSNSALGGLALYLQGDSGARYFYAHLQDLADKGDGDRVRAGDIVGFNGDSGNARGTPHLHFQWAPEGGEGWRNPYPLLEALWLAERQVPLPQR